MKNQEEARIVVNKLVNDLNKNLHEELQIQTHLSNVGSNSVKFDIQEKCVSEYETNYHESNNHAIMKLIFQILEIFERVRISQDFDLDDEHICYSYHISCGIVKMEQSWKIKEMIKED